MANKKRPTEKKKKPLRGVPLTFSYAFKSFLGYLEGTEKAHHTIKNYQSDLASFQEFLEKGLGSRTVELSKVTRQDLEKFHEHLKSLGLKTNTRRRKLMTIRKLLTYLTLRKKIAIDVGHKLPAPMKVERVPVTIQSEELIARIKKLPIDSVIERRNQVLLWTLAETGCLVSELPKIRFSDWTPSSLSLNGKTPRTVPISKELYTVVQNLKKQTSGDKPHLFFGFNKFGSLGAPITPRGVELLVKHYGHRLDLGELTPRTFRHSIVLKWFREGLTKDDIQKRLGLRSAYAFRVYDPMIKMASELAKSSSKTTSSSETSPRES